MLFLKSHHYFFSNRIIRNYILLSYFLAFTTTISAQIETITKTEQHIITKHYFSVEDGLAARIVNSAIEDKDGFMKAITEYQQMLIDGGVVGTLTYDELLKMSKEEGETLQVWTESPCHHKKHIKSIEPKEPKPYKSEPILTDDDFIELGIDSNGRSDFFKKHGKEIDRTDITIPIGRRRRIALDLLKKWSDNELH